MLCKAVSLPKSDSVLWDSGYARQQALSNLAGLCLFHPEICLTIERPLELGADAASGDICLVLSSWLRENGGCENAQKALRGRVKSCLELLSDDDPTNDGDAWLELFKTLLMDPDSDEDLSGALYMLKTWRRMITSSESTESNDKYEDIEESDEIELGNDTEEGFAEEERAPRANQMEDDIVDDIIWFAEGSRTPRGYGESYTACPNCALQVTSVSDWYFCRSCPHTVLCPSCYADIKSGHAQDHLLSQHVPQTCNSQHNFYYTGKPLRLSECEELGKVRFSSSESGEVKTLWVEEWKDQLAEKWRTKDFEFEGGFSAWCMNVLPELQRDRWACLFKE